MFWFSRSVGDCYLCPCVVFEKTAFEPRLNGKKQQTYIANGLLGF